MGTGGGVIGGVITENGPQASAGAGVRVGLTEGHFAPPRPVRPRRPPRRLAASPQHWPHRELAIALPALAALPLVGRFLRSAGVGG